MKISGEHKFDAPPSEVYERLLDPERLRGCMPGCERLEEVGEGRLEVVLVPPVPTLKGTFEGTVEVLDPDPPNGFRMQIRASGKSGFVNADAKLRIEPDGGQSNVIYDADADIGGLAASVGQRVMVGVTRRQVEQMMRCLESGRPGFWVRVLQWIEGKLGRKRKHA